MIRQTVVPLLRTAAISTRVTRPFSTSASVRNNVSTASTVLPPRKPVGAFRGGLFGFLLGSVTAGVAVYYYILEEYRVSNEMLTEDIYALQAASQRLNGYISELETKIDELQKKK
ncbi:hypothetical protein VTN77DRAFT_6565 [Rasamsonia byssochlamydoides]|uniref:uncharacterized protein n=1 Tax=Rasamsonia byssochlamydoides TaxID=89139 RepID=UPI00374419FD